jgi:HPt (histidine-containing phosphotransfer) domain-containing protein
LNVEELMARLGGSRDVLAAMIPIIAQSAAAWEAEMNAALAANDAKRLRRAAHQAKGALATLAAPRAAQAAKVLEDFAHTGDLAAARTAMAALKEETASAHSAVAALLQE